MKRILALILSLSMLLGVFAFAEETQDEYLNLLLDADVEFETLNLTPAYVEAIENAVMKAYQQYAQMTPEQLAEWKVARRAIYEAALNTPAGEGAALRAFINETIDNMENFGIVAKSNFKSSILNDLVEASELNEDELAVYAFILEMVYSELEAAESDEELEAFYESLSADIDEMDLDIHDARDNLMTLFNTITGPYIALMTEAITSDADVARDLAVSYIYSYERHTAELPEDTATLHDVLDSLALAVQELGYGLDGLTDEQIDEIEALIAEAIDVNFPMVEEEDVEAFEMLIYETGMNYGEEEGSNLLVLLNLSDGMGELLDGDDEELKADIARHIENLETALEEDDIELLNSELLFIVNHVFEARKAQAFKVIYNLTIDKAAVIAVKVLFDSWAWNEGFTYATSLVEFVDNIEWETLTEEEQHDVVSLMVEEKMISLELTEEVDEETVELVVGYMVQAMTILNSFTTEELAAFDLCSNAISLYLRLADEDDLDALKPVMEELTHVFHIEEEDIDAFAATAISIFGKYDPEERLAQFENLRSTALVLLIEEIMEIYEAYRTLPDASGSYFADTYAKIKEVISGFEIKGYETDPAVLKQLEDQIFEIISAFPALSPLENAAVSARIVSRIVNYSTLTSEEASLISDVIARLTDTLANGTEEELDTLKILYHGMLHMVEEGFDFEFIREK